MPSLIADLGGYALKQPREYRRLRRIRERIYTPSRSSRAEILRSPEPIPFAELDRSGFRPMRDGTRVGQVSTAPGCASRARCRPASRIPS